MTFMYVKNPQEDNNQNEPHFENEKYFPKNLFFFEQYLIEIHVNMAEYGEENTHDTSSQDTRSIYKSQKYFYEE